MNTAKVFGQGVKVAETDKLNIDSIIARLLEGKIERQKDSGFSALAASQIESVLNHFTNFDDIVPSN